MGDELFALRSCCSGRVSTRRSRDSAACFARHFRHAKTQEVASMRFADGVTQSSRLADAAALLPLPNLAGFLLHGHLSALTDPGAVRP